MKKEKFEKYRKLKKKSVMDSMKGNGNGPVRSPWFEDFWRDRPTREQFTEIVCAITLYPDHLWLISGRK